MPPPTRISSATICALSVRNAARDDDDDDDVTCDVYVDMGMVKSVNTRIAPKLHIGGGGDGDNDDDNHDDGPTIFG